MEGWTERAKGILDRAPTGAMSFPSLLVTLKEEGADPAGREELILKQMTEQSDRFKVIPGRLGPWTYRLTRGGFSKPASGGFTRSCDPWILSWSVTPPMLRSEERVMGRVQESLRAWGQEIDTGSQGAVARWIGANREAERVFGRLLTRRVGRL